MPLTTEDLTLPALRAAYAAGSLTPTAVATQLLPFIAASPAVFIAKPTEKDVLERCRWVLGRMAAQHMRAGRRRTQVCHAARRPTSPAAAARLPHRLDCRSTAAAGTWRACQRGSAAPCGACPLLSRTTSMWPVRRRDCLGARSLMMALVQALRAAPHSRLQPASLGLAPTALAPPCAAAAGAAPALLQATPPPRPAPRSSMCQRRTPAPCSRCWTRAASLWARQTWTSLRAALWARAPRTAPQARQLLAAGWRCCQPTVAAAATRACRSPRNSR